MRRASMAVLASVVAGALVPAGTAPAQSGPRALLHADLAGAAEIDPATGRGGAGDRDGIGSFSAVWRRNRLCYGLTVARLGEPTAARIHSGRRTENGEPVVPLRPPANGRAGAASGCVRVTPAIARAIRRHPDRFYVNVHTRAFAGGAIRGQLRRGG